MNHNIKVTNVRSNGEFEAELDAGPLYEQMRQLLGLPSNYGYIIAVEGTYNVEMLTDGSIIPYCTSAYAVHPNPGSEIEVNLSRHLALELLDSGLEKCAGTDFYVNWASELQGIADSDWRDDR